MSFFFFSNWYVELVIFRPGDGMREEKKQLVHTKSTEGQGPDRTDRSHRLRTITWVMGGGEEVGLYIGLMHVGTTLLPTGRYQFFVEQPAWPKEEGGRGSVDVGH